MNRMITGYGPTAKFLHWLIVALLIGQYLAAWSIEGVAEDTAAGPIANLHISLGVTIFILAVLRVVWRAMHPVPDFPGLPEWQRHSGYITHALLYALIIATPVLGMLMALGEYTQFELYEFIAIPRQPVPDGLIEFAEEAHEILGTVLLGVVGVHVGAALYHALIRHDGVLQRMLPGRTGSRGPSRN